MLLIKPYYLRNAILSYCRNTVCNVDFYRELSDKQVKSEIQTVLEPGLKTNSTRKVLKPF